MRFQDDLCFSFAVVWPTRELRFSSSMLVGSLSNVKFFITWEMSILFFALGGAQVQFNLSGVAVSGLKVNRLDLYGEVHAYPALIVF